MATVQATRPKRRNQRHGIDAVTVYLTVPGEYHSALKALSHGQHTTMALVLTVALRLFLSQPEPVREALVREALER